MNLHQAIGTLGERGGDEEMMKVHVKRGRKEGRQGEREGGKEKEKEK